MPKLQVKICGVKTKEAVDAAVRGGAAYIGLNFYPPSPRYVSPEAAAQLALLLPARVKAVAVLVDPTDELLEQIFSRFRPALLQLHGHEPPARVAELKARYNVPVIKALPISTEVDFDAVNDYAPVADYFLFEGRPPKGATLPGGNASSFDWKLMNTRAIPRPWFLAGGINAKNLTEAVQLSGAKAVDVSSGVERAPGEKDAGMIAELLNKASAS